MAQSNTLEFILKLTDQASKDLQGFAKNVEGVTKGLTETGEGLIKLGAAGAAGLALATKASMDFDTQLRNIQSISKSTEAEIQAMGDTFIRLSKEVPQTATELAEGFYNIQSSGFAGADAMKVLDAAARAASAGLTTTENSSKAITASLNAYGMTADKAKDISDVLFKTVDIGVVSFEELSGTIGDVLGTAANMTVSIEEVGAAIATMTKKGINASESVTALNASILAFMKPSEAMESSLKALGYASGQAALEKMTLGEAMMAVIKQGEKSGATVNDLFGNVRALKAVLALTGDDLKGFTSDLEAMQGASEGAGAAQGAFEQQSKGAAFQAKIFQNNITAIALSLRTTLLPAMNDILNAIKPVVNAMANFAAEHPKIVTGFLAVGAAMTVVGTALVILGQVVGAVGTLAKGIGLLMATNPAILVVMGIVGALILLIPVVQAVIDKMGGFDAVMTTVKGKLQPLIDLLGTVFERFKQILNNAGISGEFGGLVTYFSEMATKIDFYSKRALQIIGDFYQKVKNWLAFGSTAGDATIVQALEGIWNRLQPMRDALEPLFEKMYTQFQLAGQVMITQVKPAFDALMEVMKPFAEAVLPYVIEGLKALGTIFVVVVGGAITLILGLLTGLMAGIANMLPYVAQALEGIIQFVRGFVQVLTGIITLDLGLVWEGLKQMLKGVFDFFINTFQAILTFVSGFVQGIIAFFKGLYDTLVGHSIVPDLVNAILEWFTILKTKGTEIVQGIKDKLVSIWNSIKETVSNTVSSMISDLMGRFDSFKERVFSVAESILGKFKSMAEGITNALKSIKFPHLSIGEGAVTVAGQEIKYPKLNVDWYKNGGWVDNTGLAVVHQGEFVLSRNMLEGKQPIPGNLTTNNTTYQTPVNVTAVINNEMDAWTLGNILGYELATRGRY